MKQRSQRLLRTPFLSVGLALRGPVWFLTVFLGVLLPFLLGSGCQRPDPASVPEAPSEPPWFQDVTEAVGLQFVHDAGPAGSYFLPQIIGSGAAFLDFDQDSRLDIYLVNNGGPNGAPNKLFRQTADGHFVDVSEGSGLDIRGPCMGVAVGDVNNDGWPDVLVTQYGGVRLFLNNGNGTFTDSTKEAGLESPLWATSASFLDYDRDGWLDLVVVNYLDYDPTAQCYQPGGLRDYCHPKQFLGAVTKLYRNRGSRLGGPQSDTSPKVRFDDVTLFSGVGRVPCYGLGVLCADFDGDGWPDILVTSDADANRLWINRHNGTFAEEAVPRGLAYNGQGRTQGNMGVAWGDVNGDGLLDLFITHLTEETHVLYTQRSRGQFQDGTITAGLTVAQWRGTGFGTVLVDFDHDGALDLALVNGRVARAARPEATLEPPWNWYAERNQLFANDGQGRFRDLSRANAALCGRAGIHRSLVYGDYDGDGAVDLLVTAVGAPARLFRNIAPKRGHWLKVRAVDPLLKRDAYGAEITVRAGGRSWRHGLQPGSSYLCSHEPSVHFGLGQVQRLDAIEVHWPDGTKESFPGSAVDQVVVLRKGENLRRKTENCKLQIANCKL